MGSVPLRDIAGQTGRCLHMLYSANLPPPPLHEGATMAIKVSCVISQSVILLVYMGSVTHKDTASEPIRVYCIYTISYMNVT